MCLPLAVLISIEASIIDHRTQAKSEKPWCSTASILVVLELTRWLALGSDLFNRVSPIPHTFFFFNDGFSPFMTDRSKGNIFSLFIINCAPWSAVEGWQRLLPQLLAPFTAHRRSYFIWWQEILENNFKSGTFVKNIVSDYVIILNITKNIQGVLHQCGHFVGRSCG